MVGLGDLAGGGFSSRALAVSADGSVVVGFGDSASSSEAFIWDQTHGMRNLRDVLVNDLGLDLTGWQLIHANGISADGLTIVGRGRNPGGNREAWIAVLCENSPPSDLNHDCSVNQLDLGLLAGQWLDSLGDNLPSANLVGHWKLDESSGTTATDATGSHNGTLTNFPGDDSQWTTGRLGGALRFDGVDDYVAITGYTGVLGTGSRTVAAWIKTSSVGHIISWGITSAGEKWIFRVQDSSGSAGAIRAEVASGYIVGSTPVWDGQWHHVAAVLEDDGSPNVDEVRLYVDGKLEMITAVSSQPVNTSAATDVTIGSFPISPLYFNGQIDDVRIYDRALSTQEIRLTADLNGDGTVNFQDLSLFSQFWP